MPKLRRQTFETAIIERYRRREASVEEALIEMYLAGVSVRRVEDITEALWGTRVSSSTVSDLNKKIYATIEVWRNRPIEGEHPYVYIDGIVKKQTWAGEVRNVSLLVAIAVNAEGYREILGIVEGAKEDKSGWSGFVRHLKDRGLIGVQLIISDACLGPAESAAEFFPEAGWQHCVVHFFIVFRPPPNLRTKPENSNLKRGSFAGADHCATARSDRKAASPTGRRWPWCSSWSARTGASRSGIPVDPDQGFQLNPITHSDWSRSGVPIDPDQRVDSVEGRDGAHW